MLPRECRLRVSFLFLSFVMVQRLELSNDVWLQSRSLRHVVEDMFCKKASKAMTQEILPQIGLTILQATAKTALMTAPQSISSILNIKYTNSSWQSWGFILLFSTALKALGTGWYSRPTLPHCAAEDSNEFPTRQGSFYALLGYRDKKSTESDKMSRGDVHRTPIHMVSSTVSYLGSWI